MAECRASDSNGQSQGDFPCPRWDPTRAFFVHNAAAQSKANYNAVTDGWVDLTLTMTYSDARLIFGGWYARGKMSFADLVIKSSTAPCFYSLADDTAFDTLPSIRT